MLGTCSLYVPAGPAVQRRLLKLLVHVFKPNDCVENRTVTDRARFFSQQYKSLI